MNAWTCARCGTVHERPDETAPLRCEPAAGGCGQPAAETRFYRGSLGVLMARVMGDLEDGTSIEEIAAKHGVEPAVIRRVARENGVCLDLEEAVWFLKQLESLRSKADYVKQLLWAGQTHLRSLLQPFGAWDLSIHGRFGSGKSFTTYYTTEIARDGVVVTDFSEASLSALLDAGMDLGFEEADELLKAHRNDLVEAILRSGSSPWAKRAKMEKQQVEGPRRKRSRDFTAQAISMEAAMNAGAPPPSEEKTDGDGKTREEWALVFQNLSAPKVYNYMGIVKPATLSRASPIEIDPTKDAWHVARSYAPGRFLTPVKQYLAREAERALRGGGWSKERLEDYFLSEKFVRELEGLPTEFPRGRRIGGLMIVVSEIMGWALRDVVHEVVEDQELWQDNEEVTEVSEFVAEAFEAVPEAEWRTIDNLPPTPMLNPTELLRRFNDVRRKDGPGLGKNDWSATLTQIGFMTGTTKLKDTHGKIGPRGRWYLRLDPDLTERLRYLVPAFPMVGTVGTVGAKAPSRLHMEGDADSVPTAPTVPTLEDESPNLQRARGLARDYLQTHDRPEDRAPERVLARIKDELRLAGLPPLTEAQEASVRVRLEAARPPHYRSRTLPDGSTITILGPHDLRGRPPLQHRPTSRQTLDHIALRFGGVP